jgi:SAM-dependent methyltransferase
VLDLGCGTGRTLLPLAQCGHWVLGVDLSEPMLRVVGEKADKTKLVVHRMKANIVELDSLADGSFDYAVCLFSTLGMLAGTVDRRRVVEHVHRLLRRGGTFILHVHNYWFNVWDRRGRRWLVWDWLRSIVADPESGNRPMPRPEGGSGFALHHFTRREIVRLLRDSGFTIVEILPIGARADGQLPAPWWFGWLRAYGYLVAARTLP